MNLHRACCTALVLVAVLTARPILTAEDPSRLCDLAAAKASRASGVPIDILLAITRVETGRGHAGDLQPWPWTINADGTGQWYTTRAEAVAAANARLADGTGTFDVGCFQLNFRWHGDAFTSLDGMFDPAGNAAHAADFLLQLYHETGTWAQAVSAYHSRTGDLAAAYLDRVRAVLSGPDGPAAPLPPVRQNHFPLLQAGDRGAAGSIVPLQSARGPLLGGGA